MFACFYDTEWVKNLNGYGEEVGGMVLRSRIKDDDMRIIGSLHAEGAHVAHRACTDNNRHQALSLVLHTFILPIPLTLTGNLAWPINLTCTSLGCGRKPEHPEETHTDTGRTCKLHTDSHPSREPNRIPGAVRRQCSPLCHCEWWSRLNGTNGLFLLLVSMFL